MPSGLSIHCKVDTTGLELGISASSKYSKRTLPEVVNTALYWVAINARSNTRFVSPEHIDAELGTIVTARIGKRGKALSTKSARNRIYSGGKTVTIGEKEVPLAVAIIAARANPGSRYNRLTANRWLLTSNPFAGVTRSAGRAAMKALESRMIARRHSSGKYLEAGYLPGISIMFPLSKQKFMPGSPRPERGGRINPNLGTATPATPGTTCSASLENDVGIEGRTGPRANEALILYGHEALQRAIDQEGERQIAYAMRKMEEETAKVVQPFWR